jgi:hypothetical protein
MPGPLHGVRVVELAGIGPDFMAPPAPRFSRTRARTPQPPTAEAFDINDILMQWMAQPRVAP